MKSKGTSVWEQYIEYIVLLVAIVIFGWFAWGAFGTKIEHRAGKVTVQAGTVDDELLKAALVLENKIKDGTPSPIAMNAPEPLHNKFSRELNESVSPNQRVVFPTIDLTAILNDGEEVQSELREYVAPVVPGPQNIRTRQWFGTVKESVVGATDGLSEMAGPPHDTMWVQVAGTVDIAAIIDSYSQNGELSGIPSQWYDGGIDIFDVHIERQRLSSGEWIEEQIVATLPGRLTYREDLESGDVSTIERDSIVSKLRKGEQSKIIHPDFYDLKGFKSGDLDNPSAWGEDVELEVTPMQLLEQKLAKANERIAREEASIEKINQDIRDAGSDSGGGGIGGGGRGGGGDGGRGGSGSSNDRLIESLKRKLVKAEQRLQVRIEEKKEIESEIEKLKSESGLADEAILDGEVWVWGHDMNIVPGATYRYRMNVQLANPFFGHKPSLYPRQHSLADTVVMASQQSSWSDAVEVQESKQWYVQDAEAITELNPNDLSNHGYIRIEEFAFSDGAWSKVLKKVLVGQVVGVEGSASNWLVLDVLEDTSGVVALLQDLETGEVQQNRPGLSSDNTALRQLQSLYRQQQNSAEDQDSIDDTNGRPGPPGGGIGGGGRGGGIGGGGRGGGIGGGGGRGGGIGGGGRR